MTLALATFALLGLAVAIAIWRTRPRRAAAIALNLVAALLLGLTLLPPTTPEDFTVGERIVLTPGVSAAQLAALPAGSQVIALPGADAPRTAERVPDLATALRRHADVQRLQVIGGGLPARDRDAARGRVARFDAAPLPRGLVELERPDAVIAGSVWSLRGRVEAAAGERIELRDPSNAVVAAAALDAQGRFALGAVAKDVGNATFALDILDASGARIQRTPTALSVRSGAQLTVLLFAGAPDAELKYLRRWSVDAGISLHSRIALSEGIALDDGALALDAAGLRDADLLILDERSWALLSADQRSAIHAAVRDGLGLLLRATGPLPPTVAEDWAALGLGVKPLANAARVTLDRTLALPDSGVVLSAQALELSASDAAPLLRADDGRVLAWLRGLDRGRVALWRLGDSHRLQLAGNSAAFGSLWSNAFARIARARGQTAPRWPDDARVDQRAIACSLSGDAAIDDPQGKRTALVVDEHGCAAYWPAVAGWHRLSSGSAAWPFAVRARDEATTLAQAHDLRETQALVTPSSTALASARRAQPLPRWPFFLGFLVAAGLLWARERKMPAHA